MGHSLRLAPTLSLLLLASCATIPPPPPASTPAPTPPSPTPTPSVVRTEALNYRGPADAPKVLETVDRRLGSGEWSLEKLSKDDLTLYSQLLLAAGRLSDADRSWQAVAERSPTDPEAWWTLTLLAGAKGDLALQEKRLVRFEALAPGDLDALGLRARLLSAKGDKKGAATAWRTIVAQKEDPAALQGLARLALEAKAPSEAKSWIDRAVKADPADDQGWALRASVLDRLGRPLEAKADLDKAITLAPDDPWHRLDRGKLAFLKLYDFEAARADLEEATTRNPSNFFGWEALAEVYEELNRPRQAYDAWMKALSLRPDYTFAYPSAAMLSFRYQQWEKAAFYAKEAAKAHPAEYAFPFVEALSMRALGKPQLAQQILEKARGRFTRGSTVDEMFRFLLTPGTDYYLNTALNLEKQENVRLRLRFYQGCFYALTQSPSSARAAFEEVQASTLTRIPEIGAARDWMDHGL